MTSKRGGKRRETAPKKKTMARSWASELYWGRENVEKRFRVLLGLLDRCHNVNKVAHSIGYFDLQMYSEFLLAIRREISTHYPTNPH